MDEIPVKAVRTTFEILQVVSKHGPIRFSEIVDRLDQPKSTVYDHLQSLKTLEYVYDVGGEYQISFEFLLIGDQRRSRSSLFTSARTELVELATDTGEHVSLLVEENGMGRTIYTIQGGDSINFKVYDGTQTHLGQTAPGRTVLANLPPNRATEIIEEHGLPEERPAETPDEFFEVLEEIREQGYAIDEQEAIHGMNGVGVPIIDNQGHVLGALSVYGPVGRMGDDRLRNSLIDTLQQKANIIGLTIDLSN